jgi:hypothetical protein
MEDDRLIDAFADCLDHLQAGASLEQVLALYPELEEELRPMLLTAQAARRIGAGVRVPRAALARSRAGFLSKADQMKAGRSRPLAWLTARRFALASLMVVLVLAAGMATTLAVSAHALPGDVLYPVKIAAEQTQLLLTEDPARRLELEQSFDRERIVEVDTLIHQASSQNVQFAGGLKEMQGNEWLVGNIRVRVTDSTHIRGVIKPGYYVDVTGRLQPDGVVMAYQIALRTLQLSGQLAILSPGQWRVGNMKVQVTADTAVLGEPFSGSQAEVQAILLDGGRLQAVRAVINGGTIAPYPNTSTLQPSDTSSPQPSFTAKPTGTRQPQETEIEPAEPSTEPTEAEGPEDTPKPTRVDDHHDTPEPTESEDHHRTPQPTEGEDHGETPSPTEGDHHEDQKTSYTSQASPTPQPTEHEDEQHSSPTATQSAPAGNPTPTPGEHDD